MSPEMQVRARLRVIGDKLSAALPPKWGFALLVFPFDDREGNLNYISSGQRDDIVKVMKEFIAKTEQTYGTHQDG